jgi:ABC-type multidrug transport system ATPase subunit
VVTVPLRAEGVSKRFGKHEVLRDIDLEVETGEAVTLVGPNGAGKSTLLGCVCGTVIPDAGTIAVGGHDLRARPIEARAALRYLPQEVEVPRGLTGRELLGFFADVHGDAAGVEKAARFTELGDALDRLATTYSVGMRRQLAFGGLLPGRARLYVLDEPFAGVDRDGRARMLGILRALLQGGAGLLLAAHDQDLPDLDDLGARRFDVRQCAR